MDPFLLIERDDGVVTATLNRPQQRNAITSAEEVDEITQFCADMARDRSVGAIVFTGAGAAFCAGGNVKDMRDRRGMFDGTPYQLRDAYRHGIQRIPLAVYELEIPTIAAVNGPAMGAGLDLACMCDIRIASETAIFAESFVKLGLVPGDGGAWLLPRIIGEPLALRMTLTGDNVDAVRALEYGIVSEVMPPAEVLPAARAIARRIAANPRHATRLGKRLVREGARMSLPSLLELSAAYQALAHQCEDHHEAVAAFLEKRPPAFRGEG